MDAWLRFYVESGSLAAQADEAMRRGDRPMALALYRQAAEAGEMALVYLDRRVFSATLVSTVSLYLKGGDVLKALSVANTYLNTEMVPFDVQEEILAMLREYPFVVW